nr:DUF2934 domain-containing protein [Pseudomonas aeruginosa]
MSADEKRIREFAYQIWESEGCPDGQAERHWAMARQLAEAEAAAAASASASCRAMAQWRSAWPSGQPSDSQLW